MKREKLSLKTIIQNGVFNGLFFAAAMAAYDYFNDKPFSWKQFLFYGVFFGFAMAISFRYRYLKDNKE